MSALWTSAEIEAATGGRASAAFEVTGVTFDSREVQPGDLFIAMPGTVYDGHRFVEGAFKAGAAGAIVDGATVPHDAVDEARKALVENDSFTYLERRGATWSPGPTGTNVNDLQIALIV